VRKKLKKVDLKEALESPTKWVRNLYWPPELDDSFGWQIAMLHAQHIRYLQPFHGKREGRYVLDFVIDNNGIVDIAKPIQTINGYCPWPNNSPFLQILDKLAYSTKSIDLSGISTFFECGTAAAQTAVGMSCFFKVETVEFIPEVYEKNLEKEGIRYPINYHLGHAPDVLAEYLKNNPDERLLILLDDHDPELNAWIEEELSHIQEFSDRNDHIIIVDDTDHFGQGTYPKSLGDLAYMAQKINKDYRLLTPAITGMCATSRAVVIAPPPEEPAQRLSGRLDV
jgi:hypothetical protein